MAVVKEGGMHWVFGIIVACTEHNGYNGIIDLA